MKKILLFLVILITCTFSSAQDGKLLTTYVPQSTFTNVTALARLNDGSLIVGGIYNSGALDIVKLTPTGQIDPNFNFTHFENYQVIGEINVLTILDDGNILVGGNFTTTNQTLSINLCIIRINSTGAISGGFGEQIPSNFTVKDIKIQPITNKILVGGISTIAGSGSHKSLYRLNSSGTLDNTFNLNGSGTNSSIYQGVHDIEVYSNGDMIIVGEFTSYNGIPRASIAKINSNGSLNTTSFTGSLYAFHDSAIYNGNIYAVGGADGETERYYATGLQDLTFTPLTDGGPYGYIDEINFVKPQSDGKIIIGGNMAMVDGVYRKGIVRLNYDGTLDTCFNPGNSAFGIIDALIEPDGNILIWGGFSTFDGIARPGLAKLRGKTIINANDDSAILSFGDTIAIDNVLNNDTLNNLQSNLSLVTLTQISSPEGISLNTTTGQVTIAENLPSGDYTLSYKICEKNYMCKCDSATVSITIGLDPNAHRANYTVNNIRLQSDNKIIISGGFITYNNQAAFNIARLNTNLTLDTSFLASGPGQGAPNVSHIEDIEIQNDDKILVAGFSSEFNGVQTPHGLIRLKPDGSIDEEFNYQGAGMTGELPSIHVRDIAIQPNGKIIAIGNFDEYNGQSAKRIVGLNPDGTVDPVFDYGNGYEQGGADIVTMQGNNILLGGGLTNMYNGYYNVGNLFRVFPNGDVDPNFIKGNIPSLNQTTGSVIHEIYVFPNLEILIGGVFEKYNGEERNGLVKLLPNGSFDPNFNIGSGFKNTESPNGYGRVFAITVDDVGRILVGGDFTEFNGVSVNNFARLLPNGTLDTTFSYGSGISPLANVSNIHALYIQPNKRILIGGRFYNFNNIYAGNITRIIPETGIQARGIDYYVSEPAIDLFGTISDNFTAFSNSHFAIYPNPSEGIFNLEMKGYEGQDFELVIYNALGQLVHEINIKAENAYRLDLSNFQAGNYFVRLQNNSTTINKIITKK